MMKIFVACNIIPGNPIIRQLVDEFHAHPLVTQVLHGANRLFEEPANIDIVHLHWPEIFYGWKEPSDEQLEALHQALQLWGRRAVILATVHDLYPHYQDTSRFHTLFELVYRQCRAFIHMGEASVHHFIERHPYTYTLTHQVIPHPINDWFPNTVSQQEARLALGLNLQATIYTSFGALRHTSETEFLLAGFAHLPGQSHQLIIAGPWIEYSERVNILLASVPKIQVFTKFIPNEHVQYYINSADVVVIPRLQTLNSGNLILAFSFGKIAVGPDIGVVGEILHKTANPTFTPGDEASFTKALMQGAVLAKEGKGMHNQAFASAHWNLRNVGAAHINLYQQLLSRVYTD